MSVRDGATRAIAILTAGYMVDDKDAPFDNDDLILSLLGENDDELLDTVAALTGIALAAMSAAAPGEELVWIQALARNTDKLPED